MKISYTLTLHDICPEESSEGQKNRVYKGSSSLLANLCFFSLKSEILKISKVTPIFKSGSVSELGNYRPIAVIFPFSKVLERLVYDQLVSYLEKECLLFNFQFGFRKGYSTEYAILETAEKLKSAVDDQQITCGIFLDFSKAFDTINHHILLEKLYKYGIRGLPMHGFQTI